MNTDVKSFYDEFAQRVLLRDFQIRNRRQDAIRDLCNRFIPNHARVLEIGCGVGIISKHIQRKAKSVLSVDISGENIRLAQIYASSPNNEFRVLDVLEDIEELKHLNKFDVIVLFDVIEHIPARQRSHLLHNIESLLHPKGVLLLTYPSPSYQEYLKAHEPEQLQIVDETIPTSTLLSETSLELRHFEYRDVWFPNQYIHLVLRPSISFSPIPMQRSLQANILRTVQNTVWYLRNIGIVRKMRHDFKNNQ